MNISMVTNSNLFLEGVRDHVIDSDGLPGVGGSVRAKAGADWIRVPLGPDIAGNEYVRLILSAQDGWLGVGGAQVAGG